MHLRKAATFLILLGAAVNALQAVYAPEGNQNSDDLLLQEAERNGINFNIMLDEIILSAREALIIAKEDSVNLPDLTEDFYKNIWPFVVHGHLHCTKGSLRNLATVKRTGDAKVAYKDNKFLVIAPLGLEELVVNYVYDASVLHMGATGNLTANVTSNSVRLEVEIKISLTGCELKMEDAKITDLGLIQVNLTGLYPFDGLSAVIAEKAANSLHDTICQTAEQTLKNQLQQVINKIPCHLPRIKLAG